MGKIFEFLKELRKKPQKTRRAIFFWIMIILVPLIVFFLLVSMKSGFEKAVVNPEARPSFGEKFLEIAGNFFAKVWQGVKLVFRGFSDFFRAEKLREFSRSLFGKPRIEVLESGPEINLPPPAVN